MSRQPDRLYQLSAAQRDEVIAKLYNQGWSLRRIAAAVGMSAGGIWRALDRISAGRPGQTTRE